MEGRGIGNDDDLVFLAGVLLHFEGHGDAADAGADNDDFCHASSPLIIVIAGQSFTARAATYSC